MAHVTRFGALIACAFVMAFSSKATARDSQNDPIAWRSLSSLPLLVEHLDRWIDEHSEFPRRDTPPTIRTIATDRAASLLPVARSSKSGHTRGLYDPGTETIYLLRPWDAHNPHDVSVLLHELVHHRQATFGHWYCPGAQELPAYRLQEAWLAELGLKADINWIAVVLEAGCTPRDIHPD